MPVEIYPAVTLSCETCRWEELDLCPVELPQPMDHRCRKYMPTFRIDLSSKYKGEFEP